MEIVLEYAFRVNFDKVYSIALVIINSKVQVERWSYDGDTNIIEWFNERGYHENL